MSMIYASIKLSTYLADIISKMTFGLKPLFLNNRFCPMALNKFDILKLAFLKKRKKIILTLIFDI